jgi:type I restriction enzyme S subunit
MNTKLLKQKILDLAIRGKLTDQRKSDGTAADLLKQISEQKRESSSTLSSPRRRGSPSAQSEKTIIPLDKNEAPFEVPANWEWVRLGDVVLNRDAERKPVSKKDRNLHAQKIYDYYGAAGAIDKVEEYLFDEKLLLIGEDGANLLSRSKPNAFLANGKYWVNNHAHVIDAIDKSMLDYLAFYINAISLDDFVTGTAQPKLNQENLNKIPIPLPPLAEQQRVVAKIEEAFAEIDAIEKNKELLKTHIKQTRQKILDLAIHGKLVPQNNSDEPASVLLERITRDNPHYEKLTDIPFEIPESWEWVNAEDLFNIRSAIRIHQTDWQKEGIPFFRGRELVQLCKTGNVDFEIYISEKLYEENKRKGGVPQKNDILVSAVGTLGFAYVVKGNKPFYYKDAYILCFENRHNLNPFYFQHLIHSKFINKIIYGGSKGTTVDQLTIENAKKLPMPLPPLAEQKRIVNKIEEIFASLDEISLHLV